MIITKDIVMKTKKVSTGTKLPDQDLKLLFMMYTKRYSMEKKYISMLPTGASSKKYTNETMCFFILWVNNTPY